MTLLAIKRLVLFQTNNDADDLGDFMPALDGYVQEGYDRLLDAWCGQHAGSPEHPELVANEDVPDLPEWTHAAIADYAAYLIYRNGNPQKQQRSRDYWRTFQETEARIRSEGGYKGRRERFVNLYP